MKGIKQTEEAFAATRRSVSGRSRSTRRRVSRIEDVRRSLHGQLEGPSTEVLRPWVHAVVPVTSETRRMVPFGPGPAIGMTLLCGLPPTSFSNASTAARRPRRGKRQRG